MPQFFFDIDDGETVMRDSEGSELADVDMALREATETLVQMGRDLFRSRDRGALSVSIRDATGAALRTVRLTLTVDDTH